MIPREHIAATSSLLTELPMTLSHGTTLRRFAAVALAIAGAAGAPLAAHAQTAVANFNTLTESSPGSGTRFIGNCYRESGFLFTAVGVPCTGDASANAFLAAGANSPLFGGGATPSLLLNSPMATLISVSRTDGGAFSFTSIMLAPFDGAATSVTFTGMRAGGNVTRTVNLTGSQMGFSMFSFADFFSGVTSVQIAASNQFGEPLVKFDDFTAMVDSNVIPEPSTYVLFGTGLVLLVFVTQRRRMKS